MYDLLNIFDAFLPQLLLYPNPSDPLNSSAASLMMKKPELYKKRIRESVMNSLKGYEVDENVSDISMDDLSELSETSDLDSELL